MSTTDAVQDLFAPPTEPGTQHAVSPGGHAAAEGTAARRSLAVLRIATGAVFLWAFLDKAIGLGYATPTGRSWLSGGSPTRGFLGNVVVGPFQSLFRSWSGATWADIAFMVGLGAVGLAVVLGVGLRVSAVAGSVMMAFMWAAEWPPARFDSAGEATGSSNPFVDYHVIYALALIVLAATAAGRTWGLGSRWAALPVVQRLSWLR
jgi:thiosulfate dehydrogenase [quinone] large subunit